MKSKKKTSSSRSSQMHESSPRVRKSSGRSKSARMSSKEKASASPRRETSRATEIVENVREKMDELPNFGKRPLLFALGALGVGLIAASLVPLSSREQQLVGDIGTRVTEKGRSQISSILSPVKNFVHAVESIFT